MLSMTVQRALPGLVLVAQRQHLLRANVCLHDGGHGGTRHGWRADRDIVAVLDHQDVVDRHLGAFFGVDQGNVDTVAFGDAVLLTAGTDDCVHSRSPYAISEVAVRLRVTIESMETAGRGQRSVSHNR